MTRSHKHLPGDRLAPVKGVLDVPPSQTPPAASDGVGAFCGWTIEADEGTAFAWHDDHWLFVLPYGIRVGSATNPKFSAVLVRV